MNDSTSIEEEFCKVYLEITGRVLNPVRRATDGWVFDSREGQIEIFHSEVEDFINGSGPQRHEIIEAFLSRARK